MFERGTWSSSRSSSILHNHSNVESHGSRVLGTRSSQMNHLRNLCGWWVHPFSNCVTCVHDKGNLVTFQAKYDFTRSRPCNDIGCHINKIKVMSGFGLYTDVNGSPFLDCHDSILK